MKYVNAAFLLRALDLSFIPRSKSIHKCKAGVHHGSLRLNRSKSVFQGFESAHAEEVYSSTGSLLHPVTILKTIQSKPSILSANASMAVSPSQIKSYSLCTTYQ